LSQTKFATNFVVSVVKCWLILIFFIAGTLARHLHYKCHCTCVCHLWIFVHDEFHFWKCGKLVGWNSGTYDADLQINVQEKLIALLLPNIWDVVSGSSPSR